MTEIPPSIQNFDAVKEVTDISHAKLPPMPKKSAFMFHHNFYPKPKVDLKTLIYQKRLDKNFKQCNKTMMT